VSVYRCDWCGRFYSSPLPEDSACPDHIPEHNERLRKSIAKHNEKLRQERETCSVCGFTGERREYSPHDCYWVIRNRGSVA
jgi:dynactin complex subunit